MVGIGIIGFGFMGQTHWRCYQMLQDTARVVAVADTNPRRACGDVTGTWGNLGDHPKQIDFNEVLGTTDWTELLRNDGIHAIDICVPTPYHEEIATAALAAGKHVLCEKPLARTLKDTETIAVADSKSSSFIMPAMCMRFWPQWAWLKKVVASQEFGRVVGAAFLRQSSQPQGWYRDSAASGGALLDLHVHDTDFICHLFGVPGAVTSCGYSLSTTAIDHICTHYHYDDIPLVVAEGGWAFAEPFGFRMRFTIQFDSGTTADFDLARQDPLILYRQGRETPIKCDDFDGWYGEIKYFVECLTKNQPPTLVTMDDALSAIRTIEAEGRSTASGRWEPVR